MSGEWVPLAGRTGLRWFVDHGWQDDEIIDRLSTTAYPGDDGEVIHANTLRGKRILLSMLAEVRGKPKGRPKLTAAVALATFEQAVRERRAAGLPADTVEDVSENVGVTARTIGRWRERFHIPYASEISED